MTILGKRIIAAEYEKETDNKTEGGIFIPETARDDSAQNLYKIVSVGSDVEEEKLEEGKIIIVGNRIAQGADTLPLGGNKFKIFNEDQIIGVDEDQS